MFDTLDSPFAATFCPTYVAITAVTGVATATFTGTPVGTAAAISYCIKGKAYTKATITTTSPGTTDVVTAAAFVALAASQGCVFVLGLDASGTIKSAQGSIESLDAAGNFMVAPQFPTMPATVCPFAYIVCKLGSTGSAWTFGTSNWSATGMTATPVPVMTLPARPQIS